MTDNINAIEALKLLEVIAHFNLHGSVETTQLNCVDAVRAALQNGPEVVTFEQFKKECSDYFIYSNVKSIAKMMQRLYPNGVRIADEVK